MNKVYFYILSIISIVLLTPFVSYVLTLGVSEFEGARGFAFFYLLPAVFVILLIFWFIEKAILAKKYTSYYKRRNIFSISIIAIVGIIMIIYIVIQKQARIAVSRNTIKCQKQLSDGFEAYIYSISESNQTIKFKSSDSTRADYRYTFSKPQEEIAKSYIGQCLVKKPNSKTILFISRSGEEKEVVIPCYQ